MMGRKTLGEIWTEMREILGGSDRAILAWFDQQMKDLEQQPRSSPLDAKTLDSLKKKLLEKPIKSHQANRKSVRSKTRK